MPALEPVLHLPDRSTLAGFRSSGVHELEPYISPKVRSATVQGPSASSRPENTQDQARGAFRSTVWDGHIPADNVGFQLLKSFGWRVGSGLGAGEHGRREPIEPELPKGTRGLGFNSHTCELKCELTAQQRQQQEQRHNRKRAYTSDIGAPAPRSRSTDVVVALVRGELAQENLSDKVARHKQLMRCVDRLSVSPV